MAKKEKRFVRIYEESALLAESCLLVDRETGVTYLWHAEGYSGGLTVLLDREGKPVISRIPEEDEN